MKVRDMALSFEAVKVRMNQTKDGTFLTLIIQHADVPRDLHTAMVGTRFMVSMAAIGDDEQPVPGPDTLEGHKVVQQAAMLCKEPRFQLWMVERGHARWPREDTVATALREYCGIESRGELKHNAVAREIFTTLMEEYDRAVFGVATNER